MRFFTQLYLKNNPLPAELWNTEPPHVTKSRNTFSFYNIPQYKSHLSGYPLFLLEPTQNVTPTFSHATQNFFIFQCSMTIFSPSAQQSTFTSVWNSLSAKHSPNLIQYTDMTFPFSTLPHPNFRNTLP